MVRRLVLSLAVVVLVGSWSACGATAKDEYADAYLPIYERLNTLGRDVGRTLSRSEDGSSAKVQREFASLDRRFGLLGRELRALDTPEDLRQESRALTVSLTRTRRNLVDIGRAAKAGNPGGLEKAASSISRNATTLNAAQQRLLRASGAKAD